MIDDEDPACLDCARRDCRACLEHDPAPPGRRSCCCGREDETPIWR